MKLNLAIYYCSYPLLMLLSTLFLVRALRFAGRSLGGQMLPHRSAWVNDLLVVGMCVISAGYLLVTVQTNEFFVTAAHLVEMMTMKLGFGLMLLGLVFTLDLLVLAVETRRKPRLARTSELV